ncbi:succinate dehydrogenase, hydrophobic membrane anchor protein [Brevundimonas sp.]|uniref:succinate dehydrogenase, hydrophobic membrane anchor protein n=1 Tax=Brevundimonas sp. TaxID=1871086 RepID=UPI0025C2F5A9|nr:succinate dehydrogenase, hydrophobic membrane anchor protein [Brevundimonas sp.]
MSGPAKFKNHVKISERHGAGEWLTERVALALLMPLGLWVVSSVFTLAGAGYDDLLAWFASPLNAGLLILTLLTLFLFASLAWKVIIEDYIHKPLAKTLAIGGLNLVFLALAAASVFFIVRLALGSAPLPAGIGA